VINPGKKTLNKRRILALLIIFFLAVFTAGLHLATSPKVDRWLRDLVVGQVEKHLNVKVTIGSFERNLFLTRVAFSDVSLQSPEEGEEPIFLSRMAISIDPYAFLRGTLHLKSILIEGLSLDVVRKEDGRVMVDPLPPFQPGEGQGIVGRGIPLRFEIGQITLMNAEVSFYDESYGLALKTGNITIALDRRRFIPTDSREVVLRTGVGEVRWRGFKDDTGLEFDSFQAILLFQPEELGLEKVRLLGETVSVELSGRVPLEKEGEFSGEASLAVDLGRLPLPWEGISGRVSLEGSVGGSPLKPSFTGRMDGRDLQVAGKTLDDMKAEITLDPGGCAFRNARILYGGELIGVDFDLGFSSRFPYRLTAIARGYPLSKLAAEVSDAGLPLEGEVNAKIGASGDLSGGVSKLAASGDLGLSLPNQEEPVSALFEMGGLYGIAGLRDLSFTIQAGTLELTGEGAVSKEGADLRFSGSETDLGRWNIFPEAGGFRGSADLDGSLKGTWSEVQGSFDVVLEEPGLDLFSARVARGRLEIDGAGVSLREASVEAGSTTIAGKGHLPWERKTQKPWFEFEVANGDAVDLQRAAGLDPFVTGRLGGRVEGVVGSSGLEADIRISLKSGSVVTEGFDRLDGNATFSGKVLEVAQFQIFKEDSLVTGSGKISKGKFEAKFKSAGPVSLEAVDSLEKVKVPLAGEVDLQGTASGNLDGGDINVLAELVWEQITFEGRDWKGGDARFRIQEGQLQGTANLFNGLFAAQAQAKLGNDFPFSGTIRTQGDADREAINDLIGVGIPPDAVSGKITARAQASGILANIRKTVVKGSLVTDDLVIQGLRFRSRGEVPFSYYPEAGIRFIDATLLSGDSVITGTLLITPTANIEGSLDGTVDLKGITFLRPTVDRFSGLAAVQLQVAGRLADPVLSGSIALKEARCTAFLPFELPVGELEGNLEIVGNRLRTRGITGTSGGGTIRMEGDVILERFSPIQGEFGWKAESVPVRFPEGLYTVNRANLVLRFSEGRGILRGTVTADEGKYSREVDIENLLALIRERMGGEEKRAPGEEFSREGDWLALDVEMRTGSPIEVDIKLLEGTATGDLNLQGTAARPILSGRVEFNEGTIVYRGHVFDITSGSIGFFNPARIEPAFDFSARTEVTGLDREGTVTDYIIELVATGVPEKFKLDLLSSPALSEIDIISLLTWGAVGEQAFATRAGLSSAEAALLLTRELRGSLETGVQELTGFDRVIINPSAVTSTGERTTRVQLDKRLSESFYLTYSTPVLTSEEQEVLLKYRVSDSFSLIGQQKGEEEFGFDLDFQFQIP